MELLVHGVGGTTPQEMLNDPSTVRITGDETAAVHRRADDVDAEQRPEDYADEPVAEAYVWSNLTSGDGARALWLLLLPFMVVNLAHWMRPTAKGMRRAVSAYGMLVRLVALTLTVLLVAAACEVALDLTAWQCAGTRACAEGRAWLTFLAPSESGTGWWTQPGRRLALAALAPAALTALLWYLSQRTWSAYESQQPLPHQDEPEEDGTRSALSRPGFWYGRRLVARLRAAHTAAGLLTVAAAVGTSAARYDRSAGNGALHAFGVLLEAVLALGAVTVVAVVCRRGRSESTFDEHLDRVVRILPLGALAVLGLAVVYAGWDRPAWRSSGRLPGDETFGVIALVQGLIVLAMAAVAWALHRRSAVPGTVLGGVGGPAVAMLACALGGVMSGGVAQRVGDWLDGGGTPAADGAAFLGPPVVLSWQAAVIPVLLVAVLLLAVVLALRTRRRSRREVARVPLDYAGERPDTERTRRIAGTRARAALTDRAPVLVGIVSALTLLLGAAALLGAWSTRQVPGEAAEGTPAFVEGVADTTQALGSWLIGFGFILFVTWGRRAYRDPSARRTIGILWDVGTFWPRAAHPFAPPCYAERAVPDLTWRMATWTRQTGGRLVISGHSQGSVLAASALWQLSPSVRRRVALLTYGSPLQRLYGRWFPAHFGPAALMSLHREVDCWRNLHRPTDPIGGPIGLPGACGPDVDHAPLKDPLAYGRTESQPLPAPILGHGDYQADPVFARVRGTLLARLRPGASREPSHDCVGDDRPHASGAHHPAELPAPRGDATAPEADPPEADPVDDPVAADPVAAADPAAGAAEPRQGSSGRSSG
ncbi:hypothetical protein QIS99_22930 [Streptomyces sp. B-S-A8]|uniref:Integral membrane protein n=2 Tax=Streptomyces solicavernae TaxID=3043614 RepID=A0ABT6RX57_9ACTN|nr:hypothetical protein [Streptomyces sp. B-S-A8]MDI3389027.1 hypothetical protein [Streptomyces sp. B-S-A8]